MNLKRLLYTVLTSLLVLASLSLISTAQDYRNVLSLHTGKSYILDFSVKVTRVVGGDPAAIELNLFKKDSANGEVPGYQLLVAPIAEKSTNIIVWTDIGLYVFDVVIDNSSPYTAETIVMVPKEKKFTIPLVESSTQPKSQNNMPKGSKLSISNATGDVVEGIPEENIMTEPPDTNNSVEPGNDNTYSTDNNKEKIDNSDGNKFTLDVPPSPIEETKPKKQSKPVKTKVEKKHVVSKPVNPVKDDIVITLKPPVSLSNNTVQKPASQSPDRLEITLRPQSTNSLNMKRTSNSKAVGINSNRVLSTHNGLKLEIKSVNRVDNSLIIHLVVENLSAECKYLLWESTKVTDDTGKKLYVRNQNLPPGIINPREVVRGDLIAYPRNASQTLPSQGRLNVALLGSQGQQIISAEVMLK